MHLLGKFETHKTLILLIQDPDICVLKVFFTRNGKTVGIRQVRIPKGGFYPTVGMLGLNEKVRVDLRPLTG